MLGSHAVVALGVDVCVYVCLRVYGCVSACAFCETIAQGVSSCSAFSLRNTHIPQRNLGFLGISLGTGLQVAKVKSPASTPTLPPAAVSSPCVYCVYSRSADLRWAWVHVAAL